MTFQSIGATESADGCYQDKQMNGVDKQRLYEKLAYAEQDLD